MEQNRDFKGVWIPKEIWLNTELTMLDKVIYTEISSLDNEEYGHCTAGNEYLAEFCQCSITKVSKSITKLVSLGLVEIISFDGRHRTLKILQGSLVKNTRQSCKKYKTDSQNLQAININNNIDNKVNISKDILTVKKSSKDKYLDKLEQILLEFDFSEKVQDKIIEYFSERKGGKLVDNKIRSQLQLLAKDYPTEKEQLNVIDQSYRNDWGAICYQKKQTNYSKRSNRGNTDIIMSEELFEENKRAHEEMLRIQKETGMSYDDYLRSQGYREF